ncbi:MAG: glycosyltransferase family 4 protein [Prevotella sp.]|nr:glycosyltransferase family 4 protein [Prevotella sp.]
MKRVVCFHLLNDYSGSPIVLRMALRGLLKKGCRVDLVTTRGGVLDDLQTYENLTTHTYRYHFSTNPAVTMARYIWVQLYTFVLAFRWLTAKKTVFYINTLLPVGPALAGRMMGKRVVYHYHENAKAKGAFYRVLAWLMQRLAHQIICVSAYQASKLKPSKKITVIPNALPQEFAERVKPDCEMAFKQQNILMLSSLKSYKGTDEFIMLAAEMPEYHFTLVINDEEKNIKEYIGQKGLSISENLCIHPRQDDVVAFYQQASIVLNLSQRNLFIETFGMTALEAMTAGLPVIGPTEGGIAEIVKDGFNGYQIDCQEKEKIAQRIREMLSNKSLYSLLAKGALETAKNYSENRLTEAVEKILEND